MKKCIFLFAFLLLGMGLSYAVENKQPGGRLTNKPPLGKIQQSILQLQDQKKIPLTPRADSPRRLQTPRTPRVPEKYCIPYFFDGTVQYIILKKNQKEEAGDSNPLLIPLSEKGQFIENIKNVFTIRSDNNETLWLEKKVESAPQINDEYETYLVDDNSLSEEIKKQINAVSKKALFVPLFYQIINEQLNVLIKQKPLVEEEETKPKTQLKIFLPIQDDFFENGSQREIEKKINNIIEKKIKITNLKYNFLPIIISDNSSQIIYMQMIDLSDADLYDVLEKKEYFSMSLEQILNSNPISSKNVIQMKEYIKKLYNKFDSKNIDQTKIDQTFVELFIKKYKQHEQEIEEKLEKKKLEIIAKEQAEAERKKEAEEKTKQIELEQQQKIQLKIGSKIKKNPEMQEIEQNLKPTEVVKEKKEEKKKIEKILQQKNIEPKQNETQNVEENKTKLTIAIKPELKISEIKQEPRSKSQEQISSVSRRFNTYPQTLNHMNQIITFVSDLFDTHYNKKSITNIACSDEINQGLFEAEKRVELWIALPLAVIENLGLNQAYSDLQGNGNATIYINQKPIQCIYRSEIKMHAIVFLYFNDKDLKSLFDKQLQELHKNKNLYIGLNDSVDNTLLCTDKIVVCSVDSITTWLKDNNASDGSIKQSKSKVEAIFPRLIKSKKVLEKDVNSPDNKTGLPEVDSKKGSTLNVGESPIEKKVVEAENTDKAPTILTQSEKNVQSNDDKKEVDPTLTSTDEKPVEQVQSVEQTNEPTKTQQETKPDVVSFEQEGQSDQSSSDIQVPQKLVQENVTENEPLSNQVGFFDQLFSFFSNMVTGIKNFFLTGIKNFFLVTIPSWF